MSDLFNFETSGEVKQYLKANVMGDIFVDVHVEFKPMWQPHEDKDKMALDMVNTRLRLISGEISHSVREMLKERLMDNE